jgi:hypothetical protein
MKIAIRTVAWLISFLVAVQAASIAYALMSIGHLVIEEGRTLDQNSEAGSAGFALHAAVGMEIIPALAVVLLVLALICRQRPTTLLAVAMLVAVMIQVVLGIFGGDVPALGWLHGLVAFVVFVLGAITGQRVTERTTSRMDTGARA